MSYTIATDDLAEEDLIAAFEYYKSQSDGLKVRFFQEVQAVYDTLRTSPKGFVMVHDPFRRAPVRIFPNSIFYWVDEDERMVVVTAALHQNTDPRKWPSA